MSSTFQSISGIASVPDALRRVLVDELFVDVPVQEIRDDDSLRDVLGLDSLGFVELRAQCERMFQVEISEEDFSPVTFASISTLNALITRLSGQ